MKIEIEKKKKLRKIKTLKLPEIDFSSIKELKGNKSLLEYSFYVTNTQYIND